MTVDRIFVRAIGLNALVGVLAWERERAQPIEIDIDAYVDTSELIATGNLSHGVDFALVARLAREIASQGHVDLVEELADSIAYAVLDRTPAVRVCVEVRKLESCSELAGMVGVSLTRSREQAASTGAYPTTASTQVEPA